MANIKEVCDGGSNPNTPSVAEMRESQRKGSVGTGTQSDTYNEMVSNFNMGCAEDIGPDKTSYPRWSNDEEVANYPAADTQEPWVPDLLECAQTGSSQVHEVAD